MVWADCDTGGILLPGCSSRLEQTWCVWNVSDEIVTWVTIEL
jgi:hypothetical protein